MKHGTGKPLLIDQVGVAYAFPMAGGFSYVGRTKRFLNDRFLEHMRAVKNKSSNYGIAKHVQEFNNCLPDRGKLWY